MTLWRNNHSGERRQHVKSAKAAKTGSGLWRQPGGVVKKASVIERTRAAWQRSVAKAWREERNAAKSDYEAASSIENQQWRKHGGNVNKRRAWRLAAA